ncbi:MAG: peptide deformylase, partial [Nitrospira sp.]
PDFTGNVLRYGKTIVEGLIPSGTQTTIETSGLEALAFQHELDHLAGILFLDRVRSMETDVFRRAHVRRGA